MLGVGAWGRPATVLTGSSDGVAASSGKPAWGPLQTGAAPLAPSKPALGAKASGAASAPSGGSTGAKASSCSRTRKEEPIDYFDMTS